MSMEQFLASLAQSQQQMVQNQLQMAKEQQQFLRQLTEFAESHRRTVIPETRLYFTRRISGSSNKFHYGSIGEIIAVLQSLESAW